MPAQDRWGGPRTILDPRTSAVAVTPSDSSELAVLSASLYIGGAGNIKVTMKDGQDVTFNSVPAGTTLHIQARRVFATGTTATAIVALW